jgi:hypothetical protein
MFYEFGRPTISERLGFGKPVFVAQRNKVLPAEISSHPLILRSIEIDDRAIRCKAFDQVQVIGMKVGNEKVSFCQINLERL